MHFECEVEWLAPSIKVDVRPQCVLQVDIGVPLEHAALQDDAKLRTLADDMVMTHTLKSWRNSIRT